MEHRVRFSLRSVPMPGDVWRCRFLYDFAVDASLDVWQDIRSARPNTCQNVVGSPHLLSTGQRELFACSCSGRYC